jgi:5'-nucleotidase
MTWRPWLSLCCAGVLLAGACSDDDGGGGASTSTTQARPLAILVTNDDGFAAAGLDAVVRELQALPRVTVTVVAPADNRSGSGDERTEGALDATPQQTATGFPAVAVDGFPVDAVAHALDEVLEREPDLVVAGVNEGANLGPLTAVSGTVGAALEATARGVPAVAASQGFGTPPDGTPPDYASGAAIVAGWVAAHREELASGRAPVVVLNLNVPTCSAGTIRGVAQVPAATSLEGANLGSVDCLSAVEKPRTDVAAFDAGFASVTALDEDGEATTSTTRWSSR